VFNIDVYNCVGFPLQERYKLVLANVDWPTAKAYCEAIEANFVMIRDCHELDDLVDYLEPFQGQYY